MTQSLLPQKINVYAIVPYAFIPTFHKFNDKLVFGSIADYPYRMITHQSTSAIHYLLAHTNIDKATIEQTFKSLANKTWQQIVLDYINGIVECLPYFEQLYAENSIRPNLANIGSLISNIKNDLVSYQSLGCPLIYALTRFVKSLYTLFFLNYTSNYNEHPIILDSDDKLEQIAKHITYKETKANQKILRQLEQNGIRIGNVVSGIPISELTKWMPEHLNTGELNIILRKNYYPLRDPIVFAIRRRPITGIGPNTLVDHLPVLVEFIYTHEQIKEIVHLFELLFTQLQLRINYCNINDNTMKLLQFYYLYFATPYYANDSDDEISVPWLFPHTIFVSELCDWDREYFRVYKKLPGTRLYIERLYVNLYTFMPPHILPFIVQDLLNQFPRKPFMTCKQLNKLQYYYSHDSDRFIRLVWSRVIGDCVLQKLKQITHICTDLTPIAITTFCTPYEAIRFELVIKALFIYSGKRRSLYFYPLFEHLVELLINRYGINELIYSTEQICAHSQDLLRELKNDYFTILEVPKSYERYSNATRVALKYFDELVYMHIPQLYLSEIQNKLKLPDYLSEVKLYLYNVNPIA